MSDLAVERCTNCPRMRSIYHGRTGAAAAPGDRAGEWELEFCQNYKRPDLEMSHQIENVSLKMQICGQLRSQKLERSKDIKLTMND